ncbi:MAG: conjugal transfer protein TraH [Gammaproteobacteria bacterium]|nr:conjugal transfer protein TraH [Gammaproteobacteria bacterium]
MRMTRLISLILSSLILMVISQPGRSDVASDLTAFVNSVGGASTSTPASIYEGQSRGYINGGRVFARIPQRSVQPIAFRAPKFTAGCGGIDMFGGSLSFISATELVNTLKSIGSSAGSYALMLGLRTISSQIANTMEKSFDWLQKNTSSSISSCEQAASLLSGLGGAMGINDQEKNLCIIQTMEASAMSYDEAKNACTTGGGPKSDIDTPQARNLSFVEGNLVWRILESSQMFTNDNDMKRMAMTLTGTIVKRQVKDVAGVETTVSSDADSQSKLDVYPSLMLTDEGILDALLYGASITRYGCNDSMAGASGCREVITETWTLTAANSLVAQTRDALMSLYNAVRNRTDPTTGDIDYVAETAIPTMRIVRTAALLGDNGLGVQIIDDYAEQIAIELLSTYVSGVVNGIYAYSYNEGFGEDGDKLREGIQLVMSNMNQIRQNADINLSRSLQIAEQMEYYERIILGALPRNLARSLDFTKGGGS